MSDRFSGRDNGDDDTSSYPQAPLNSSGFGAGSREHPENDLSDDADYANLYRPEPRDFDELADQEDPLVIAEKNRRSSKQAWRYLALAILSSLAFGVILLVVMRMIAGADTCAAVDGRFLCTEQLQKTWAVLVSLPPIAFLFGCMALLLRKLNAYLRWRPWMGVFWVLVVFTMWVLLTTVQVWLAEGPAL